jgi:hypothetical protein
VVDCSGVEEVCPTVVFFVADVFLEVEDEEDEDDDEDKVVVERTEESLDADSPDEVLFTSCRRSISLRACCSTGSAETTTINNVATNDNNTTCVFITPTTHNALRNRDRWRDTKPDLRGGACSAHVPRFAFACGRLLILTYPF